MSPLKDVRAEWESKKEKERCEYCNNSSDDLQKRHVKERGGGYAKRAWNLCPKCRAHFLTKKRL